VEVLVEEEPRLRQVRLLVEGLKEGDRVASRQEDPLVEDPFLALLVALHL